MRTPQCGDLFPPIPAEAALLPAQCPERSGTQDPAGCRIQICEDLYDGARPDQFPPAGHTMGNRPLAVRAARPRVFAPLLYSSPPLAAHALAGGGERSDAPRWSRARGLFIGLGFCPLTTHFGGRKSLKVSYGFSD